MLFDTHIHTCMSADSEMSPGEAIRKANELGIGIIFTEHVDYDFPAGELNFVTDVEAYLSEYETHKNHRVLTGLEIGLTTESMERNKALSQDPRLDYVLGSVHMVNGTDICTDFYKQGIGERDTYIQYLQYVHQMIEHNDFFDCLGHIDYPTRYSPFPNPIISYDTYAPYYDTLLKSLIEKEKCIEINTVCLRDKPAAYNLLQICKRYHALGGWAVTIGSDAHSAAAIARGFKLAAEMGKEAGLEIIYFSKRKIMACV